MRSHTFRAVRPHEVALAAEQALASFGGDAADLPAVQERLRRANDDGELWGVDADGVLVGHCRLLRVEHFFGGRGVASMDVAGVAVSPPHRRRGAATALLEGALAWGAHQGLGLSMLFPAVPSLYRGLGWEHGGTYPRYRLETPLATGPAETMRTARTEDWPAIRACSDRYAQTVQGAARRSDRRWEQLRAAERCYVLDSGAGIEAYVLVFRGADPSEGERAPASVDWAAASPRGVRAVVATLNSDALRDSVVVHAPHPSFWSAWSDTWTIPEAGGLYWMARPVQLPRAIEQRGFPGSVSGSVTLAVDDRYVLESQGPWRLEVAGGHGVLHASAEADVLLDVRAAGPLFTGFRTPQELALAGLLDGPPAALEILQAMFAGPPPIALDFF